MCEKHSKEDYRKLDVDDTGMMEVGATVTGSMMTAVTAADSIEVDDRGTLEVSVVVAGSTATGLSVVAEGA